MGGVEEPAVVVLDWFFGAMVMMPGRALAGRQAGRQLGRQAGRQAGTHPQTRKHANTPCGY